MYNVEQINFETRDEYSRINIAENIYNNIKKSSFYSPCLLDGQWGSGKTEFCHKLYHYIEEHNVHTNTESTNDQFILTPIYINVFNAERINNPFVTLMGGIVGAMPNANPESLIETASSILKAEVSLKPIGIAAVKDAANFCLGIINKYMPDITQEVTKQIADGIEKGLNDDLFRNAFAEVNKLDQQYNEFSTALEAFATPTQPLLFIVDELDRCRPDFAVQFLECIKHFFNVENVYFLLSCNVDQLLASIEHLYGSKINSENYLEKFFEDKITLNNQSKKYDANISILRGLKSEHFLGALNAPTLIEFLFETYTLRQHHKINNKYEKLLSLQNEFNLHNSFSSMNLGQLTIFILAYLITTQNIKNYNEFVNSSVLKTAIQLYYENMYRGFNRPGIMNTSNEENMALDIELYFDRLTSLEKIINNMLERANNVV